MNKISTEVTILSANSDNPDFVSCIVQLSSKPLQAPKVISDEEAADQIIAWFDKYNKGAERLNIDMVYIDSVKFMQGYRVFNFELRGR